MKDFDDRYFSISPQSGRTVSYILMFFIIIGGWFLVLGTLISWIIIKVMSHYGIL